ncbi:MAG: acetoacetate--CoA ligase [Bacteroidota bacterium]
MQQKILWQPSDTFIQQSNLTKYQHWLAENKQLSFPNYEELWQWSTTKIADFWESIWDYFNIIHDSPYQSVLIDRGMPEVEWFTGATLNYAQHIFRQKSADRPALIFQNEITQYEVSWAQLEKEVKAIQQYLLQKGIQKGDCVVAYLPNIPAAISCFLAVNSIGAVWSCCSPDFGEQTVIDRFTQINPKLFIAVDGYTYGGKSFDRTESVENIRASIASIKHTLFLPYLNEQAILVNADLWENVLQQNVENKVPLTFAPVPFDHPIWVLYSSGTTGKPKAITHSTGGVLLEHLKYLTFHNDVKAGEHFFWFTTTGWMMWNFMQASLLVGAVPVLYDGSPAYPSMKLLWELAEALPIHHFGTSAPFLTTCMKRGMNLREQFDFTHLRSLGSTGAPLPPEVFEWVYDYLKKDLWLCSISGGTDICTAFVGGTPYLPVYKGYIQSRSLGCALFAYNEDGRRVEGQLGEMIIEQPMPSMPIYFWNDPDKKRYTNAYFATFPNKWRHGDWINIQRNGSLIIHGRSDATLNRNGIRIGTAEIYNVLNEMSALKDSLIINLEQSNGEDMMPLFVVLADKVVLDDTLKKQIKHTLRTQCSPRHVPTHILAVPDIPYTLSGKKMEVPIKRILMSAGQVADINKEAIRNPAAMDYFLGLNIYIE